MFILISTVKVFMPSLHQLVVVFFYQMIYLNYFSSCSQANSSDILLAARADPPSGGLGRYMPGS